MRIGRMSSLRIAGIAAALMAIAPASRADAIGHAAIAQPMDPGCKPDADGAVKMIRSVNAARKALPANAKLPKLPMDSEALDGWLLVADGFTGCSPVPLSLKHPGGAIQRARAIAASRPGLPVKNRVIVYVNGVANSPEIECEVLTGIRAATGATVIGVYNGSRGLAGDLAETINDNGLSGAWQLPWLTRPQPSKNQAVQTARAILVHEVQAGHAPEVWAHSQGGAIASVALFEAKDFLAGSGRKNPLRNVKVTSFGAAAPAWPDGPAYEHYIHADDPAPRYAGLGLEGWADRWTAGRNAKVIRFSGSRAHFTAADPGMPTFRAHDILAVYLPRWEQDHWRPGSLLALTWGKR